MAYNITNITGSNSFYDMIYHLNMASDMWLFIVMFFVIWIMLLITFKRFEEDMRKLILFTSTIMAIVGIGLQALGFIGHNIMIIPIIGTLLGFLLVYFGGD